MSVKENEPIKCTVVKWRNIQDSTGPVPKPRHGHRAVVVKDLIVIFGGGNSGLYDELHVFNPATHQWFIPAVRGDIPPALAAHGMVSDGGTKVIMYAGMQEYGKYGSELYMLQASRWEWKKMKVKTTANQEAPVPRIGQSFTHLKSKVYMFGGLANDSNDPKENIVRYLDELYVLHLTPGSNSALWEAPDVIGTPPSPRESHTANIFSAKQKDGADIPFLVIYGGMDGTRLGDVHMLRLDTKLVWVKPLLQGNSPPPRSLHTADVMDNRLYIFGGWTPLVSDEFKQEEQWSVSGQLSCLNLGNFRWEEVITGEELCPPPRAGHCSASVHSRIYVWSGRDGYKKLNNHQLCFGDIWCLETARPGAPSVIQLVQSSPHTLEVCWGSVPTAEAYLLQVKIYDLPQLDFPSVTNKEEPTPKVIKLLSNKGGASAVKLQTVSATVEPYIIQDNPGDKKSLKVIQKAGPVHLSGINTSVTTKIISVVKSGLVGGSLTPISNPKGPLSLPPGSQVVRLTQVSAHQEMTTSNSPQIKELPPPPKLPGITTITALPCQQHTGVSTTTTPSLPISVVTPLTTKEQFSFDSSLMTAAGNADKDSAGDVPAFGELIESSNLLSEPDVLNKRLWRDVTVINGTSAIVSHYCVPELEGDSEVKCGMAKLVAGQAYKLRVAGINACGRGKWSPISAFRTALPHYPSPPSNVRILKHGEGAHISWEHPLSPNGTILEYSVYMAVSCSLTLNTKSGQLKPSRHLTFSRVFVGTSTMCLVPPNTLDKAHLEKNPNDYGKSSIMFRVAAKNGVGYGTAVQIRWLQDPNAKTLESKPERLSLQCGKPEMRITAAKSGPSDSSGPAAKALKLTPAAIDKSGRLVLKTLKESGDTTSTITLPEAGKSQED